MELPERGVAVLTDMTGSAPSKSCQKNATRTRALGLVTWDTIGLTESSHAFNVDPPLLAWRTLGVSWVSSAVHYA